MVKTLEWVVNIDRNRHIVVRNGAPTIMICGLVHNDLDAARFCKCEIIVVDQGRVLVRKLRERGARFASCDPPQMVDNPLAAEILDIGRVCRLAGWSGVHINHRKST